MDKQALLKKWPEKWRPGPLTLILLGLIAYLWFYPPATVSNENRPASPYLLKLADGRTLTSGQLKGKVVLVNFWATWCPYCRKEMPAIDEFWQDYRGRGFEVLAVSVDDTPAQITAWFRQHGYRFAAAPMDESVRQAFGNVSSLPTSFIVDADGTIRHKVVGQVYYGRLKKLVSPLLGSAAPSPVAR